MVPTHSAEQSALDLLDADVRAEVRRQGVDPQTDVESVRGFARSAVASHDQRSLSGVVRPVDDPDEMVDELVARVAGFGPLQRYLDDPTVEEVWINEPERVFVARDGRHELTTTILEPPRFATSSSGCSSRPPGGSIFPARSSTRCFRRGIDCMSSWRHHSRLQRRQHPQVRGQGQQTDRPGRARVAHHSGRDFLEASVLAGLNIVVAGGTQAGKTTMLNALGSSVPGRDRIISCEEVFELRLVHPDFTTDLSL